MPDYSSVFKSAGFQHTNLSSLMCYNPCHCCKKNQHCNQYEDYRENSRHHLVLVNLFWKLGHACVFWSFNKWAIISVHMIVKQFVIIFCSSVEFNVQYIIWNRIVWKCLMWHICKAYFWKVGNYGWLWCMVNVFGGISCSSDFLFDFIVFKFKCDAVAHFQALCICKAFV